MSTSAFSQAIASAGWFGDPLDRFDGRFFDGDQWTDQVSDKGVLRCDPSWATAPPATSADPTSDFAGTERRSSHDRRQINIKVDVERRKADRRAG